MSDRLSISSHASWCDGGHGDTPCCSLGPHRRPEGPCEDVAVCPECYSLTFAMRPPGECFGHHAPDCSLPERHESYCKPGGAGHPTGHLRGYPEFTWESRP